MTRAQAFELAGFYLPDGLDPFGVWQLRMERPLIETSGAAQELVWIVDLPGEPDVAYALLATQEQEIAQRCGYLERLEQQVTAWDPELIPEMGLPEVEQAVTLSAQVAALKAPTMLYSRPGEVRPIYQQGQALLERFRRLLAYYARTETRIEGVDVGMTTVDWSGDFNTLWQAPLSDGAMQLHYRAVHLALEHRIALLRFVGVVLRGAMEIAAKASIPGGQVLLIPALYRFVRDVVVAMPDLFNQPEPVRAVG